MTMKEIDYYCNNEMIDNAKQHLTLQNSNISIDWEKINENSEKLMPYVLYGYNDLSETNICQDNICTINT